MNKSSTPRPATQAERERLTTFLQAEYIQTQHGYEPDDQEDGVDCDHAVAYDCGRIEELVEGFTITVCPQFFPDGDLIEVRVWEIDFLNTFQHFKQLSDGCLARTPTGQIKA